MMKPEELSKVERGAMQKNLDALLAKPFLDDAEQQLVNTLSKKLAAGVSDDAFARALAPSERKTFSRTSGELV
jgi:hypothetical protein